MMPAVTVLAFVLAVTQSAEQSAVQGIGQGVGQAIGQVNGAVFDKDHKGLPGLTVAAIASGASHLHGTSTDEGGRYAFKGLESGTYSIILAQSGGGVARKDAIRVRPLFRSIVDFSLTARLQPGELPAPEPSASAQVGGAESLTISWILQGRDREPVPDATVTITPVQGAGGLQRCRTDGDGTCALNGVAPGVYRMSAKAPGYMTWSLAPVPLRGSGALRVSLLLVPFPMGFEGSVEDLLIPADPIPSGKPTGSAPPR
jgi:hypothetical protein